MNEKLPPLPAPSDFSDVPSIAHVWGYTSEQVEAIRREAVMLCARVADDFNRQTISEWPDRIAEAILSLLEAPDSRGQSEPARSNEHAHPVIGVVLPSQSVRIGGEGANE